ncbi:hypothetical protein EV122DRAFT_256664 [Schizophyllum commune]
MARYLLRGATEWIIRFIVNIARYYFLPDYGVTLAETLIPDSDISQHILTTGTSNMKFCLICLNDGLLLGTVKGASIEIGKQVGTSNVLFFSCLTPEVEQVRYNYMYHPCSVDEKSPALACILRTVSQGLFSNGSIYKLFLNTIHQGDYYLIADDFDSYIDALKMIKKSIYTVCRMSMFSLDRAIMEYAESYWNLQPIKIPA